MPGRESRAGTNHLRLILFAASILAASVLPAVALNNALRGGLLYDEYWTTKNSREPTGIHPLYPPTGIWTGSETFRCKECHGWDYKGVDGAYGQGIHYTGIRGVFGTTKTTQELTDLLKSHGYGTALRNDDISDLVAFLQTLVIDTDLYIDAVGRFRGETTQAQVQYPTECASCHGADGTAINPTGDPNDPEYLGTVAEEDPWQLLHKIRFSQPGETPDMPPWLGPDIGGTDQTAANMGRWLQDGDFPTGKPDPGPCGGPVPPNCEDGNPCTANACDPIMGCISVTLDNGTSCADADLCDGTETCQSGTCTSGAPPTCNDQNACTTDGCVAATGCAHTNVGNGTPCPDTTICNGAETCQTGVCTAGPTLDCNDGDECRTDTCNAITGCINTPIPGCLQCAGHADCNDNNPCTADVCDAEVCRNTSVSDGDSCSDGNLCNGDETCQGGACAGTAPPGCDDQNPCTLDSCDRMAGCQHGAVPNGASCADADRCNGDETCQAGNCTGGNTLGCDDGNPCTADVCDAAGGCHHTAAADGTPCPGADACHAPGTCRAGACATSALDCNDNDACTIDGCSQASGCTHAKVTGAAGVLCGLEQGLGATACGTQPLPRNLGRLLERANALIRQAAETESERASTKALVKAGRKLRKAQRLAARAARAGKLGEPCADGLAGLLDDVRQEIARAVTPRR